MFNLLSSLNLFTFRQYEKSFYNAPGKNLLPKRPHPLLLTSFSTHIISQHITISAELIHEVMLHE